jgi:hypothetical protein
MPPPNWFEKWIKIHGADLKGSSLLQPGAGAFTAVTFNHPAEWQSDTFLDAADTTRIAIPNKLAGRYFVRATIRWERFDGQDFQIPDRNKSCFLAYLTKNGAAMVDHLEDTHMSAAPVVKATKTVMYVLWEGTLRKNDFIKLFVSHEGTIRDGNDAPIPVTANVWLSVRRLGPPV